MKLIDLITFYLWFSLDLIDIEVVSFCYGKNIKQKIIIIYCGQKRVQRHGLQSLLNI